MAGPRSKVGWMLTDEFLHVIPPALISSIIQTATDSSSNSSQRREPTLHALAPAHFCETRRHHCVLGNFYEQHRPSDPYFLDPVSLEPQPKAVFTVRVTSVAEHYYCSERFDVGLCLRPLRMSLLQDTCPLRCQRSNTLTPIDSHCS